VRTCSINKAWILSRLNGVVNWDPHLRVTAIWRDSRGPLRTIETRTATPMWHIQTYPLAGALHESPLYYLSLSEKDRATDNVSVFEEVARALTSPSPTPPPGSDDALACDGAVAVTHSETRSVTRQSFVGQTLRPHISGPGAQYTSTPFALSSPSSRQTLSRFARLSPRGVSSKHHRPAFP